MAIAPSRIKCELVSVNSRKFQEGTRIADDVTEESEELVSKESRKIVSTTNRLVLADFNFKNVDHITVISHNV